MSEETTEFFSLEEDTLLKKNRRIREKLITLLIKDEENVRIPEDKSEKALLVQLMDGMDKEIVTRAKLKVHSKEQQGLQSAAAIVADALMKHRVSSNIGTPRNTQLPDTIPAVKTVPGETDNGMILLNKDDFIEK